MGKSSPKQQIVEYRTSIHFGVSLSADALTGIWVNEKLAWEGNSTQLEPIAINKPDLFGGQKKEGGLVGTVYHLPGRPDQVLPADVASRFNMTPQTAPAFRRLTTLMFVGGTARSAYGDYEGGVDGSGTSSGGGFLWSTNSPIIAQTVWFRVRRAPKTYGADGNQLLDPALAMIGPDANPAHMIFECLTNTEWGMGDPASNIDVGSFAYAAQMLHDESFGLSMVWVRQTTIEAFVGEILDHIQATLFVNPKTGLWTIKLLRDDYDVSSLRVISPDNANLTNYRLQMWGEAANEISVSWTNPENEEAQTVTAQDLSSIINQGGSPVSDSRDYHGIRNKELAQRVANRDVRASAAPLVSASVELDRTLWDIVPGEVLLLNWPENNVYNMVVRALTVDYGKKGEGTIRVPLLQDVFSLDHPITTTPPGSTWEDTSTAPEPIDASEIITLPSYFVASADFQASAVSLTYPEVLAGVLAYQEASDVRSYELMSNDITSTGILGYASHGSKTIVERTVLPTALGWETESRLDDSLVLNKTRGPKVGSFVFFGSGSDAQMEIGQVIGFDNTAKEWVVARGVLDTVPRAWTVGTPVWFLNSGEHIVDEVEIRSAGETVEFKPLPRTSKGALPLADATTISETLTARPHFPLRPANVKVNGVDHGSFAVGSATEFHVTWSTRNRLLEDGQVVRWTAGPIAPEYEQATIITVRDQFGNAVYVREGLWTESEVTLQKSWFNRYSSISIEVGSRREDLNSLQSHVIVVTGLPANPAADPPPAPPTPGPAPSPEAAPVAGSWAATGTQFELKPDGTVLAAVPAILVSGTRDRPTAVGLIVRYKKHGSNDWFVIPEVALDSNPTQSATTAVAANTTYDIEIAYRSSINILSGWTSLGTVTTGQSVAQALEDLTAAYVRSKLAEGDARLHATEVAIDVVTSALDAIDGTAVTALLNSLTAKFGDVQVQLDAAATAIIDRSLDTLNFKTYLDSLTYLNGEKVKHVLDRTVVQTADLIGVMDTILIRNGDATSALVRYDKVEVGDGYTLAQALVSLQSAIAANTAAISTNYATLVASDQALALATTNLQAAFNANVASVNTTLTSLTTADSALSASQTSLQTAFNANVASVNSSLAALSAADSSFATAQSALQASFNSNVSSVNSSLSALSTADSTMAAQISSLSSSLGYLNSNISTNYVTNSSLSSAFGSYDSTIKAWVNNPSANTLAATVTAKATALATLEGQVYSRYVLEANAAGQIASMSLLSAYGITSTSAVKFDVNNFLVGSSSHSAVQPLYFDATTGTLYTDTITVRNANIENASITRLKIQGGSVTAGGAVSGFGATTISVGTEQSILGLTVNTYGGRCRLSFSCYLDPVTWGPPGSVTQLTVVLFTVYRNGTAVRQVVGGVATKISSQNYLFPGGMCSFLFSEVPPAGTHYYEVTATVYNVPDHVTYNTPDFHVLVTEV